jgi:hypothetical protein
MTLEITISILVGAIILLGFANYQSRKPTDIDNPWAIPWNGIQFITILVILLMTNHAISLYRV